MAPVTAPAPSPIRSLQATRRRLFATPKSIALAASLALLLVGSMAGSIVWSLNNQQAIASFGSWLLTQGEQIAWFGIRGLASNFMEQPWYRSVRGLFENP